MVSTFLVPEQGILFGFSTPEQGGKFKTQGTHTRLIEVESPLPPPGSFQSVDQFFDRRINRVSILKLKFELVKSFQVIQGKPHSTDLNIIICRSLMIIISFYYHSSGLANK